MFDYPYMLKAMRIDEVSALAESRGRDDALVMAMIQAHDACLNEPVSNNSIMTAV